MPLTLDELAVRAAGENPDALAVTGRDGAFTYVQLHASANRCARTLSQLGVKPGDRVGLYARKSPRTVAAMQAVLRIGAAYVPIDPRSPPARAKAILRDCGVSAIVSQKGLHGELREGDLQNVPVVSIDEDAHASMDWAAVERQQHADLPRPDTSPQSLAFILYTSGSTGVPKGVCISHGNAWAFVEWAARCVDARREDRFASHAPFNFDLSVFDLYGAFSVGASVALVSEDDAYSGVKLVEFVRTERISVWYSVPTAQVLMMDHGHWLEQSLPSLRVVIFAGEIFPVKHLRRLRTAFAHLRLLNFYGPTETNVCTYFEVRDIPEEQTRPVPIGHASCGDRVWAARDDGGHVGAGEEGELMVEGPTVMMGYWGRPPHGDRPYPTGDIVRMAPDGAFDYVGRKDQMVKLRGYRIELGEVEAVLARHDSVRASAVVVAGEGSEAQLVVFLQCAPGAPPTLLDLKRHCAKYLPPYMNVTRVYCLDELPRTANGKIDRGQLRQRANAGR